MRQSATSKRSLWTTRGAGEGLAGGIHDLALITITDSGPVYRAGLRVCRSRWRNLCTKLACPASPRTSTTPPPSSDPVTRSNRAISSSSAAAPPTSPRSASTSAMARWPTLPAPVPTSEWNRPRRPLALPGATTSSAGWRIGVPR